MISLDQVLLLEEKVESAVAKIQQLEAENDALRNKCSELTNALSAKTEQLAAVESDQNKIESGIIKAIDRLNSIENTVLKAAGQTASVGLAATAEKVLEESAEPVEEAVEEPIDEPVDEPIEEPVDEPVEENVEQPAEEPAMNFDSMEPVTDDAEPEPEPEPDSESTDELGFDIF